MSILWWIILFILGYGVLFFTAEFLVEEIIEYIERYKISPVVFGVLFLGIEVEESSASIFAAFNGLPLLSLGNLIGNSIIAIAIGFAIPFLFLKPNQEEFPIFYPTILIFLIFNVLLATVFPHLLSLFSLLALMSFVLVVVYSIKLQRSTEFPNPDQVELPVDDDQENVISGINLVLRILFGFVLILIGGQLLVISAENIIEITGISEAFFGLVIMAFVTNGEELFLMISALRKEQFQLGVGAQIGKIIWNLSLVFGLSGLLIGSYDGTSVFILSTCLLLIDSIILLWLIQNRKFSLHSSYFFIVVLLIFLIIASTF